MTKDYAKNIENEREIVAKAVEEIGTQVVCYVPRSPEIQEAENRGGTVFEFLTNSVMQGVYNELADRILADQANQKAETVAHARQFLQEYPLMYQRLTAEDVRSRGLAAGGMATYDDELGMDDGMAMGGIAALAGGGMPPRYLRGGGDGMSDSIPARISGKQEARLADGEFVVPADVVSHIGNGSSNAGAKKLYAMMDRARQARTGKTRQAPAINAKRYMPA